MAEEITAFAKYKSLVYRQSIINQNTFV